MIIVVKREGKEEEGENEKDVIFISLRQTSHMTNHMTSAKSKNSIEP